ncbi:MAG: hypothetical protein V3U66_02165 [Acidobacteriota bacterium]
MGKKIQVLIYLFYCFEVGLFLLFIPWMKAWEANYFLERFAVLRPILLSGYTKGAVSSFGLVHLLLGFSDALDFFGTRKHPEQES